MQILLDTNAFIRMLDGSLPAKVERRVLKPGVDLILSVVTPWEIALKRSLVHAGLTQQVVESKIGEMDLRVLSITLEHTSALYALPMHHNDPFDRILIAQALTEDCPVVTSDQRFPLYANAGLKVLWND
jgi:PIN domain nuclease of toxin-antitoxin system